MPSPCFGVLTLGVGDSVKCYFCGGGLRTWQAVDDPWIEHARYYPACGHVYSVKGPEFVKMFSPEISQQVIKVCTFYLDDFNLQKHIKRWCKLNS